jgi:hypothetical protein
MPEICGDMVGNGPRGSPCFLLAGDPVGNAPIMSPLLFGHFPKCIRCQYSLAFPKESPILCTVGTAQMVSKSL